MNEWGFIGQDIFVGPEYSGGKSITSNEIEINRIDGRDERLVLSMPN